MGATGEIVRLSLFFFLLFTPFSSYMTILTHIYEDADLPGIGPATLASNYISFICSTFFAPALKMSLKGQLLLGGVFYTLNYSSGFIASFTDVAWLKFLISCGGAFLAGLSGGPLWVTQGRYIHLSCQKYGELGQKGKMFGIFSSIYCLSSVSAGIITTFGLGYFDARTYFVIITLFGIISILFCFFLVRPIEETPQADTQSLMQASFNESVSKQEEVQYSIKDTLKRVLSFFPAMKSLILVLLMDGISLGFYSSEIPHLVFSNADKSQINKLDGYLMISLGIGATIGGVLLSKISDRATTLFTGRLSILFALLGTLMFAVTLQIQEYGLALATAFEWGFFLFFLEGWTYLVCSRHFGGRAEAFSVNKQLHSIFYLIFQLSLLPSGNKIPLLPIVLVLGGMTIPTFLVIGFIPVDYLHPSRRLKDQ